MHVLRPVFRMADRDAVAFAAERGFGILVAADEGGPRGSHVPFVIEATDDAVTVGLHLTARNPLAALADGRRACGRWFGRYTRTVASAENAMNWADCPDVESRPGYVSGAWVVKGTRVQADAVVDNFDDGFSAEEIVTEIFPSVPLSRARRILEFAGRHVAYPA